MTEDDGVAESAFLRLPAHPRYLRIARVVAAVMADELGADFDELDDVRLAVGEACSLAVAAGSGSIELEFELRGESLTVRGEARPAPIALEPDDLALTEQILAGTTAEHELQCDPNAVSFRLQFRNSG